MFLGIPPWSALGTLRLTRLLAVSSEGQARVMSDARSKHACLTKRVLPYCRRDSTTTDQEVLCWLKLESFPALLRWAAI